MSESFNYEQAFSRTIGWVTKDELQTLRTKRIAIAGLGGAGGIHLSTLTRLGIGNFTIADFDSFEIHNFNRQVGANIQTLGQSKIEVVSSMAKSINPELSIVQFSDGVNDENLDSFLKDVDLYVDGLDFFALDIREKVFNRCYELNIPAITAAPIGMGVAYLIFLPHQMNFEDYFCFKNLTDEQKRINFLIGLNPKAISREYLVDPTAVDFDNKQGPSTIMACQLCAGVAGVEAMKILLGRGKIYAAPYYHFFDPYLCKFYRGKLWGGNKNPTQYIKKLIVKNILAKAKSANKRMML